MNGKSWREYSWRLIDREPQPPAMHMALDEVLTWRIGIDGRPPTLRFWR
jgi:lipoate-protein ligase A